MLHLGRAAAGVGRSPERTAAADGSSSSSSSKQSVSFCLRLRGNCTKQQYGICSSSSSSSSKKDLEFGFCRLQSLQEGVSLGSQ